MNITKMVLSSFFLAAGLIISCAGGSNDTIGPSPLVLTGATAKAASVDIAWTNPADPDLHHVEVSWSTKGVLIDKVPLNPGSTTYSITGLTAATDYDIILTAIDTSGNGSAPSRFSITTPIGADRVYFFIYTLEDLDAVRGGVAGHAAWDLGSNYILMADLDLNVAPYNTGVGWTPLGNNSTAFTGVFNGNNHRIFNLFISNPLIFAPSGLFGCLDNATVRNLRLMSVNVHLSNGLAGQAANSTIVRCSVDGFVAGGGGLIGYALNSMLTGCTADVSLAWGTYHAGGLVGYADNSTISGCSATVSLSGDTRTGGLVGTAFRSTLSACSAQGSVTGMGFTGGLVGQTISATLTDCSAAVVVASGASSAGGLVGYNESSTLTGCSASGAVVGTDATGGLTGYNDGSSLTSCYATGAVSGTYRVGGLVGYTGSAWIRNCYARGPASGNTIVGGLAGESENSNFEYNYATGAVGCGYPVDGGGFVGYNVHGNSYTYDYFDTNTTGQNDTWKGGQPRTTAEMMRSSTYQYWNFVNTWGIDGTGVINSGYPYLQNNHW